MPLNGQRDGLRAGWAAGGMGCGRDGLRAGWAAGGMGAAGWGASAEFGFADGLEVRHAGGVRDGAVEADAGPAAVEL